MKQIITLLSVVLITAPVFSQTNHNRKNPDTMKLNAGIITEKIAESKKFYTEILNFGVTFENEFYLLLHTPNHKNNLAFMLPEHPTQQPIFHKPFAGQGMFITIEVEDVDKIYEALKAKNVEITVDIRDEPWGDRHFAIVDPNGIGIDLVTYTAPEQG
ncbi:VOC family protein [Fulvivirgaceae bacterium BMA12]|uniref:VOC family protein n=1 Tax=Agaribacillus aureus TaxID=3051825 RepID=A0ABT8L2F8_9BACT|nr:VOC family protein [Fulvivirgaceae bacterium BMA12]